MLARPLFGGSQQLRSGSEASLSFRNNEPVDFRANLNLQQRLPAHMHPPDHSIFGRIGHEYGVLRGRFDSEQPLAHLRRRGRISQLPGEHRDPRRVSTLRPPDSQLGLVAARRHLSQAALRRSRACTAALFNSRSASAAIHRAARESCRWILSAQRIASRLSRTFLFPIFRKAQLIAFFTKLLSSSSRSITRKNRAKRACGAALSL